MQVVLLALAAWFTTMLWSACSSRSVSGPAEMTHDTLFVTKDALVDLNSKYSSANNGYTGCFGLGGWPRSGTDGLFQFQDLSSAASKAVKARLLLRTCASGADWKAGEKTDLKARVFALQSAWTEGTGNWFWNVGDWHNAGKTLLANYVLPPAIQSASLDPIGAPGVNNSASDLIANANVVAFAPQAISVAYPASSIWVAGIAFPGPQDLVTLEIDVTEYVNSLKSSPDFGFVIAFEGTSNTKQIIYFSKDLQAGDLGARIIVDR